MTTWFLLRLLAALLCVLPVVDAWSTTKTPLSRRDWMARLLVDTSAAAAVVGVTTATPAWAAATFDTKQAIGDLELSIDKMKAIPE